MLDQRLDDEGLELIDTDDAEHHARLFSVMIVVGLGAAAGLWVGQRSVGSITAPIRALAAHLARVARGEFARIEPRLLKLEITESVLMQDVDATVATLHALKALGIQLAIDDFGTGYSSRSYLKRFPVDTLKIDRSFVSGLGHDAHDTAIVRSVVSLAKTLNLSVTGEGIETAAQQLQLAELGCDQGQGFLYARPGPALALENVLRGTVSRGNQLRAA
jgi:EAL domain-containing protein (putative c-di-GMP-specific phosphodiesterase class I)